MSLRVRFRFVVLALVAVVAMPVVAQEEGPATNVVIQTIDVTPMPGHGAAFEAGVAAYMAWAREAGNVWTWLCWETVAGEDTGRFRFGSYAHEWADFDSPPVPPQETAAAIDQHVAPHVQSVETAYAVARADLSNYARTAPAPMYMVYTYQVKNGKAPLFEASMRRYRDAILEHAPEVEFVVHQTVLGAESGRYLLAMPMEGMADVGKMPNLDAMMQEALGDLGWRQLTDDYYSSIVWEKSAVVVLRPDMSLMPAQ